MADQYVNFVSTGHTQDDAGRDKHRVHTPRMTRAIKALPRPKSSSERPCAFPLLAKECRLLWSASIRRALTGDGWYLLTLPGGGRSPFHLLQCGDTQHGQCVLSVSDASICQTTVIHLAAQFSQFASNGISSQKDNTSLAAS